MRNIKVVAALIEKYGEYLIGLRSTGKFVNLWEFPGGKVEVNEDYKDALKREIKEEFNVDIEVKDLIKKIEHQYPEFYLEMYCYDCKLLTDDFKLNDHSEIMWFDPKNPVKLNWLPADVSIVEYLIANSI
jgi:8-oxo-dGTP diphosphatase